MSTCPFEFRGEIEKEGRSWVRSWKRRAVLFRHGVLHYAEKDPKNPGRLGIVKGYVNVCGGIVDAVSKAVHNRDDMLACADAFGRRLAFQAPSSDRKLEWLDLLQRASVAGVAGDGWLDKRATPGSGSWKRRFCRVRGCRLYWCPSKTEAPLGQVDLIGCTVSDLEETGTATGAGGGGGSELSLPSEGDSSASGARGEPFDVHFTVMCVSRATGELSSDPVLSRPRSLQFRAPSRQSGEAWVAWLRRAAECPLVPRRGHESSEEVNGAAVGSKEEGLVQEESLYPDHGPRSGGGEGSGALLDSSPSSLLPVAAEEKYGSAAAGEGKKHEGEQEALVLDSDDSDAEGVSGEAAGGGGGPVATGATTPGAALAGGNYLEQLRPVQGSDAVRVSISENGAPLRDLLGGDQGDSAEGTRAGSPSRGGGGFREMPPQEALAPPSAPASLVASMASDRQDISPGTSEEGGFESKGGRGTAEAGTSTVSAAVPAVLGAGIGRAVARDRSASVECTPPAFPAAASKADGEDTRPLDDATGAAAAANRGTKAGRTGKTKAQQRQLKAADAQIKSLQARLASREAQARSVESTASSMREKAARAEEELARAREENERMKQRMQALEQAATEAAAATAEAQAKSRQEADARAKAQQQLLEEQGRAKRQEKGRIALAYTKEASSSKGTGVRVRKGAASARRRKVMAAGIVGEAVDAVGVTRGTGKTLGKSGESEVLRAAARISGSGTQGTSKGGGKSKSKQTRMYKVTSQGNDTGISSKVAGNAGKIGSFHKPTSNLEEVGEFSAARSPKQLSHSYPPALPEANDTASLCRSSERAEAVAVASGYSEAAAAAVKPPSIVLPRSRVDDPSSGAGAAPPSPAPPPPAVVAPLIEPWGANEDSPVRYRLRERLATFVLERVPPPAPGKEGAVATERLAVAVPQFAARAERLCFYAARAHGLARGRALRRLGGPPQSTGESNPSSDVPPSPLVSAAWYQERYYSEVSLEARLRAILFLEMSPKGLGAGPSGAIDVAQAAEVIARAAHAAERRKEALGSTGPTEGPASGAGSSPSTFASDDEDTRQLVLQFLGLSPPQDRRGVGRNTDDSSAVSSGACYMAVARDSVAEIEVAMNASGEHGDWGGEGAYYPRDTVSLVLYPVRHFPRRLEQGEAPGSLQGRVRLATLSLKSVLERRPATAPLLPVLNKWQGRRCAACGAGITTGMFGTQSSSACYCWYTELLLCPPCFRGGPALQQLATSDSSKSVEPRTNWRTLPWRMLHRVEPVADSPGGARSSKSTGDAVPVSWALPVCAQAARFIDKISRLPVVEVSLWAPRLFFGPGGPPTGCRVDVAAGGRSGHVLWRLDPRLGATCLEDPDSSVVPPPEALESLKVMTVSRLASNEETSDEPGDDYLHCLATAPPFDAPLKPKYPHGEPSKARERRRRRLASAPRHLYTMRRLRRQLLRAALALARASGVAEEARVEVAIYFASDALAVALVVALARGSGIGLPRHVVMQARAGTTGSIGGSSSGGASGISELEEAVGGPAARILSKFPQDKVSKAVKYVQELVGTLCSHEERLALVHVVRACTGVLNPPLGDAAAALADRLPSQCSLPPLPLEMQATVRLPYDLDEVRAASSTESLRKAQKLHEEVAGPRTSQAEIEGVVWSSALGEVWT